MAKVTSRRSAERSLGAESSANVAPIRHEVCRVPGNWSVYPLLLYANLLQCRSIAVMAGAILLIRT